MCSYKENKQVNVDYEEFYNYKYWRETQRKQLTITSNIFFTFNVAIIAFIINYLLKNKIEIANESVLLDLFLTSIILFTTSIIIYVVLNVLKLVDYRQTAKLIRKNKSFFEIRNDTKCLGKSIWIFLCLEIGFSVLALFITLFVFYQIIFRL